MGGTDKTLLLLGDDGLDGEDAWDLTKRLTGKSTSAKSKDASKDTTSSNTEEEDPIKWGRQRGQELERERGEADMDYLPEDYFDGMTARRPRGEGEEEDDDFLETMFLVVLCAVISGLIFLRGRWVARQTEEQRRREGREAEEQEGNAMFPLGENFGIDR